MWRGKYAESGHCPRAARPILFNTSGTLLVLVRTMPYVTQFRDHSRFANWPRRIHALLMAIVVLMPAGAMPSLAACSDAEELQEEAAIGHGHLERRATRYSWREKSDTGYLAHGRAVPLKQASSGNARTNGNAEVPHRQLWPHLASAPLRL